MKDTTDTKEQAGAAPHEGGSPVHWLLRARGPVLIDIEDSEGRHVGPIREAESGSHTRRHSRKDVDASHRRREDEAQDRRSRRQIPDFPNLFEIAIPGVAYHPGRTFSWVSLLHPGKYHFRLLGRTACTVDIYWTGFSDTARLNTTFFHAIPMTAGDTASFEYNTISPAQLVVTFRNDAGTQQREITPTAILSAGESGDETPPTTSITVVGDEAHVSATDNPGGSGILHTLYTTDLLTFKTFIPPFLASIPPDARLVMAFSVDRNGNREYPGVVLPVLGLSQTRFVFRAIEGNPHVAPQLIRIFNRDPVPLTGSVEWMIEGTSGSWLRFEPREGKTPGVVTLSVNVDGLKPGTYNGVLTISSPSPGTVFARQQVVVELLVEASPFRTRGAQ